jgi:hypothetical protein
MLPLRNKKKRGPRIPNPLQNGYCLTAIILPTTDLAPPLPPQLVDELPIGMFVFISISMYLSP